MVRRVKPRKVMFVTKANEYIEEMDKSSFKFFEPDFEKYIFEGTNMIGLEYSIYLMDFIHDITTGIRKTEVSEIDFDKYKFIKSDNSLYNHSIFSYDELKFYVLKLFKLFLENVDLVKKYRPNIMDVYFMDLLRKVEINLDVFNNISGFDRTSNSSYDTILYEYGYELTVLINLLYRNHNSLYKTYNEILNKVKYLVDIGEIDVENDI